jgi:hypothetical protein
MKEMRIQSEAETATVKVSDSGGCSFCWYWWNCWPSLWEVIVRFVDIGGIVDHHCERWLLVLLILVELLTIIERLSFVLLILVELLTIIVRGDRSFCWNWWNYWPSLRGYRSFCWYWWNCWPSLWEVIVRFVEIGGTIDHHCERWLLVLLILVEQLTIIVRGDCSFCWYWWNCWPSLGEVIARFVDIGGIVDHHCERGLFVLLTIIVRGDRSFYWWNCWPSLFQLSFRNNLRYV